MCSTGGISQSHVLTCLGVFLSFSLLLNVSLYPRVFVSLVQGRLPVKWTAYEALLFGQYSTMSDV